MFVTKKTSFQNKTFLQEIFVRSKTNILNYSSTNKKNKRSCICVCVSVRARAYYFLDFLRRVNPSPLNALNSSESFIYNETILSYICTYTYKNYNYKYLKVYI